jgi:IS605 OrfB family transposase
MKLVAQVKLLPDAEQRAALLRTLEAANAACDYASAHAWRTRAFGKFDLQKAAYRAVRERFGLGADIAVRVFAKVADAYKLDRRTQRTFAPRGAFPFNDRLVSYKLAAATVSIWTLAGRQKIAFVCGARQRDLLAGLRGECDLVYRHGEFYLFQTCEVAEAPAITPVDFLGVDLGIVNIATDSDGTAHQGKAVANVRFRQRRLRAKLQRKGTKSSRRRLKRLSGKERRLATDVNHCISKQLAQSAKDTGRGLALEDLTGIRDRVTARRSQRARLHSWSFHQLCAFIAYKAQRAGVPVVLVDPRNTSRTCPACGHIDKANRPTQSKFSCVRCGFAGLADHIAAENIRRAAVNLPNVSTPLRVSESIAVRQGQVSD